MRRINYYILLLLSFCMGCDSPDVTESSEDTGATIKLLLPQSYYTRTIDNDNLITEQVIRNISIFLTEPSSAAIVEKYVYAGFSFSGDRGLVTISSEPSILLSKDIYVIANYNDENELNQLTTLDGLRELTTPEVNKTNNLDPSNGFCMFGSVNNFNFNNQEGTSALVTLERTCAKFRINLSFPENPALSTNNSFLMQRAAKYTYVIENPIVTLPQSDYFNFAAPDVLTDNGDQVYVNTTYVYEANQRPVLSIYTHLNNSIEQHEFTITLPIPERNYLYDLFVEVYEHNEDATRSGSSDVCKRYYYTTQMKIYSEKEERFILDEYLCEKE